MSDDRELELPVKLDVLMGLEATVYVSLSAREDSLQISAPFGEISIPYTRIAEVTGDATGGIRLDAAGGTTVLLDVNHFANSAALLALLQEKVAANRKRLEG